MGDRQRLRARPRVRDEREGVSIEEGYRASWLSYGSDICSETSSSRFSLRSLAPLVFADSERSHQRAKCANDSRKTLCVLILRNEPDAACNRRDGNEKSQDLAQALGDELAANGGSFESVPMDRLVLGHRDYPFCTTVECFVVLDESVGGRKGALKKV